MQYPASCQLDSLKAERLFLPIVGVLCTPAKQSSNPRHKENTLPHTDRTESRTIETQPIPQTYITHNAYRHKSI